MFLAFIDDLRIESTASNSALMIGESDDRRVVVNREQAILLEKVLNAWLFDYKHEGGK